jgi:hypothetical protein
MNFLEPIKSLIDTIAPGQRIKYQPPQELIWDNDCCQDYYWEDVEEIQMLIRNLPEDIFATLRFNKPNLTVDIYRLS